MAENAIIELTREKTSRTKSTPCAVSRLCWTLTWQKFTDRQKASCQSLLHNFGKNRDLIPSFSKVADHEQQPAVLRAQRAYAEIEAFAKEKL